MKNKFGVFFITATIVFISRLPFLGAGYGTDPDAWRIAGTARMIAATGEYRASRLPGYPLQELAYSLIDRESPYLFNLCTALLSALAVGFFSLTLVRLGSRDVLLTSMALASVPILYVNSTTSMDYLWALSAVLASLYFVTLQRPLISGILLGVATGCRITSAILSVPFVMILLSENDKENRRSSVSVFLASFSITAAIAFVPVVKKYGLSFLHFYEGGYPSFLDFVRIATLDVWGILGSAAIGAAITATVIRGRNLPRNRSMPGLISRRIVLAWIVAIALLAALFARLPAEAAYLVPAIPFVLLLSARSVERRLFVAVCILVICSSFVLGIDSVDRPWSPTPSSLSLTLESQSKRVVVDILKGPIVNDRERRIKRMQFVERLLAIAENLDKHCVIVAGVWLPQIVVMGGRAMPPNEGESPPFRRGGAEFVGLLDWNTAQSLHDAGERIYFVPGQDAYNLQVYSVDLASLGGVEIR